ncbi:HAD hydrolase-like protein [Streptomyces sp. NPDC046860]|uniref:HAD family hydrolase n=1 Tax=Streptomyces sp. NPDC046860 TaxID=3154495 RepID=UPI0033D65010
MAQVADREARIEHGLDSADDEYDFDFGTVPKPEAELAHRTPPRHRPASRTGQIHIVWDWNGTLKDDRDDLLDAVNHTLRRLRAAPIDLPTYRAQHILPVRTFYDRLLSRSLTDEEWRYAQADFAAFLTTRPPRLRPGTDHLLARVRALGHSQSVLSLYPQKLLHAEVERLDIATYFARVDGRRGGDGTKAGALRAHLAALHVPPSDVLLIGDTADDGHAALANGVHAVLHSGGIEPVERLRSTQLPVVATLTEAVITGVDGVIGRTTPEPRSTLAAPNPPLRPFRSRGTP